MRNVECRMNENEEVKKKMCEKRLMTARKIRIKIRDYRVDDYILMVASLDSCDFFVYIYYRHFHTAGYLSSLQFKMVFNYDYDKSQLIIKKEKETQKQIWFILETK